jgi:hypothetical protein
MGSRRTTLRRASVATGSGASHSSAWSAAWSIAFAHLSILRERLDQRLADLLGHEPRGGVPAGTQVLCDPPHDRDAFGQRRGRPPTEHLPHASQGIGQLLGRGFGKGLDHVTVARIDGSKLAHRVPRARVV